MAMEFGKGVAKALERHEAFIGILFMKIKESKEKRKVKGHRLNVRRKMK